MLKKVNQSFQELISQKEEAKKKMLDNSGISVYNIYKDVGGLITPHTSCKKTSNATLQRIVELGNWMKTTGVQKFPELPCPIIAGGAIRDLLLGKVPKDYDIFVDISDLDKDEADDLLLLYANELSRVGGVPYGDYPYPVGGDEYAGTVAEDMVVYEIYPFGGVCATQVIGRRSKPLDTVNSFDYNLVKGYYDPVEEIFHLSEELLKGFENKEIIRDDDTKTERRVNNLPLYWKYKIEWKVTTKTKSDEAVEQKYYPFTLS